MTATAAAYMLVLALMSGGATTMGPMSYEVCQNVATGLVKRGSPFIRGWCIRTSTGKIEWEINR